jgi:hypothetical protein
MVLFYRHFGINVLSELVLPLPQVVGKAEVDVCLGPVAPAGRLLFESDVDVPMTCHKLGDDVILAWPNARFRVGATRVVVDTKHLEEAVLLLLHAVWSVVLAARGKEALHGSAIERNGRAMAILGASGTGKSTACSRLLNRGWRLVTDDLLAFDDGGKVLPGPPFIRTAADRAEGRAGHLDAGGKVRLFPTVCPHPAPLAAIIIQDALYRDESCLSGVAAVDALLTQIYGPRLTHPGQAHRRLAMASELTASVPVYGVPPRSLTTEWLERLVGRT